jgi:nitroreductase
MRSRRSVRRFKPEMPDRELIGRLIEAAVTAPSASNKQPWRFLVVTDRSRIAAAAAAVRSAVDEVARHIGPAFEGAFRAYGDYFTRFEGAPVVIVPLHHRLTILSNLVDAELEPGLRERIGEMEEQSGVIGASLALQNLLLMAHDLGLGASGMTGPLVASGELRRIFEVPESWRILALVPAGFPAEEPAPTSRRTAERVTTWLE